MSLKGFRTFAASGAMFVVGMLGVLGTVDLQPIVQLFVKQPATLALSMALIGISFGVLRYYTTTAPGNNGEWNASSQYAPLKVSQRDAGT